MNAHEFAHLLGQLGAVFIIAAAPVISVWAVNVLAGTSIPTTIETYIAVVYLWWLLVLTIQASIRTVGRG